jgi:L-ascorbate metabolism protein UlaG (beta-lactamase superfamily)
MKVTKYPQSCIVLEKDGQRLMIDPGSFVSEKFKAEDLLPVHGILITHEHADHADSDFIKALIEAAGDIPVVGNESTTMTLNDVVTNTIVDTEELTVAGFRVNAYELPHCKMPDGSDGPQNTGYCIDGIFFHPGDGTELDDLKVQAAAIPIAGPDVSPKDAFTFARQLGIATMIPIHYDYFTADPEFFASVAEQHGAGFTVIPLKDGETTEV